jgi:UDP-glucose 4-epimerase
MIRGEKGIFWPQNEEYVCTGNMVKKIAEVNGHKIILSRLLNLPVSVASHLPGKIGKLANKAFGNMVYEKELSKYDFPYQIKDFDTSILETEKDNEAT